MYKNVFLKRINLFKYDTDTSSLSSPTQTRTSTTIPTVCASTTSSHTGRVTGITGSPALGTATPGNAHVHQLQQY